MSLVYGLVSYEITLAVVKILKYLVEIIRNVIKPSRMENCKRVAELSIAEATSEVDPRISAAVTLCQAYIERCILGNAEPIRKNIELQLNNLKSETDNPRVPPQTATHPTMHLPLL